MPAQDVRQESDSRSVQDRDQRRDELARFDQFLDSHREIAEQVRKDPSLVNNKQFVKDHPALQTWLQQNPEVRADLTRNPDVFMHQENRYDNAENRREFASFDGFLDSHREEANQLRKNPSLANDTQYLKDHPALNAYLQDHPEVRQELRDNPNAFMQQENSYDRSENARMESRNNTTDRDDRDRANGSTDTTYRDNRMNEDRDKQAQADRSNTDRDDQARTNRTDNDADRDSRVREDNTRRDNDLNRDTRDRDTNRRELADFNGFLDSHREEAEQLRKNPALVNDGQFLKSHPQVQAYLQDHPQVREELKENPNAFMHQENRYDTHENEARYSRNDDNFDRTRQDYDRRDNDVNRDDRGDRDFAHSSFHEFLGSHTEIARQLSKDPSLVKRQEYLSNHPELQQYLNAHPEVQQRLMADPQNFVKSAQQSNAKTPPAPAASPTTTPSKPKQ